MLASRRHNRRRKFHQSKRAMTAVAPSSTHRLRAPRCQNLRPEPKVTMKASAAASQILPDFAVRKFSRTEEAGVAIEKRCNVVSRARFERATHALKGHCSTS